MKCLRSKKRLKSPVNTTLVLDGEGVLQGMDVVLLVDGDLAQADVEEVS